MQYSFGKNRLTQFIGFLLFKISFLLYTTSFLLNFLYRKIRINSKKLGIFSKNLINKSKGVKFTIQKVEIVKPHIMQIKFQIQNDPKTYFIVVTSNGEYLPLLKAAKDKTVSLEPTLQHCFIVRHKFKEKVYLETNR